MPFVRHMILAGASFQASRPTSYVRIISSDPISELKGLTRSGEWAGIVLMQQCALGFAQTCIQEIRTINTTLDSHVSTRESRAIRARIARDAIL